LYIPITEEVCLLYAPPGVTLYILHKEIMYFVGVLHEVRIIFLYSIPRMVFLMEKMCSLRSRNCIFLRNVRECQSSHANRNQ